MADPNKLIKELARKRMKAKKRGGVKQTPFDQLAKSRLTESIYK